MLKKFNLFKILNIQHKKFQSTLNEYIKNDKTIQKLQQRNINNFFPIQYETYNYVIEGKNVIARDRTGSGKTMSYALPLTEKLRNAGMFTKQKGQNPLLLVLVPTRELAVQVNQEFNELNHDDYRSFAIYGGTSYEYQVMTIKKGVEIIICTPGRLIDLLDKSLISLEELQAIVLDEADQMLDMGFQEDIEKIYNQIPQKVQNMLFSATLPNWIHKISKQYIGEDRILIDLVKKQDNQTAIQVEHLALQSQLDNVYNILPLLLQTYLTQQDSKCIIFCETKLQANAISINAKLNMSTAALHGDISQSQREQVIRGLNNDKIKCLIATNVAARGLDLPQIDLIIQLSPPKDVESFIHRSGRTARAGKSGVCITVYQKSDVQKMFQIEREAKFKFKYIGLPQNHNIIEQQIQKIQQQFELINEKDLDVFLEPAKIILNKFNPEQAIQRLMKIALGINNSQQYFSLQNGQFDRITMKINQNQTVLLETIKANLDRQYQAYYIRIFDDYTIFDIKSQQLQQFIDLNLSNPKIKIEILKQLPENYRPQEETLYNSDFRNNRRDSGHERGNYQSKNSRDNSNGSRYQQRDNSEGNRFQGRTNNYEERSNNYEGRSNNYEGRTKKYEGRYNNQENRFQKQRNNDNEYEAKDQQFKY